MANVLVVDYGIGAARRLGQVISKMGLKVREVKGSAAALREAMADPPDVVLIDLATESGDGFGLATMLKVQATARPPKVVHITAMTGALLSQIESTLRCLGIDRCVSLMWPLSRQVEAVLGMLGKGASPATA